LPPPQNKKGLLPFSGQSSQKNIPFLGQYFFLLLTLKRKKVNSNEIFWQIIKPA